MQMEPDSNGNESESTKAPASEPRLRGLGAPLFSCGATRLARRAPRTNTPAEMSALHLAEPKPHDRSGLRVGWLPAAGITRQKPDGSNLFVGAATRRTATTAVLVVRDWRVQVRTLSTAAA
jgi:hypothetical protein